LVVGLRRRRRVEHQIAAGRDDGALECLDGLEEVDDGVQRPVGGVNAAHIEPVERFSERVALFCRAMTVELAFTRLVASGYRVSN
jgi:hypothetical protein